MASVIVTLMVSSLMKISIPKAHSCLLNRKLTTCLKNNFHRPEKMNKQ